MLSRESNASRRQSSAQQDPQTLGRILVVEDEALIAMDIERALRQAGYEVVGIADDYPSAVALFQRHSPDLVLMDISIQGARDGIETARELVALDDVPVVFLTAYADQDTLNRAVEISPYGYILKPFDERALRASVSVVLKRHAIERRRWLLEAAVDTLTMGLVVVDVQNPKQRVSYCNDAFVLLVDRDRERIIGQPMVFPETVPESREALERLSRAIGAGVEVCEELVVSGAGGELRWLAVTVTPILRRGESAYVMIFLHDTTEEQNLEQMLLRVQRLDILGQFVGGIIHDLNNILTVIHAQSSLKLTEPPENVSHDEILAILSAAQRGAVLTQRLKRLIHGLPVTMGESGDLVEFLWSQEELLRRILPGNISVVVHCEVEPGLRVSLDETSLEQILLNLVLNARDAMPSGGTLELRLTRPDQPDGELKAGHYLRLDVRDTGCGMDATLQRRIFEPFFTTRRRGEGSGLGLSMSRRLAAGGGGRLVVQSAPGEGSTFTLLLPIIAETGGR